MDDRLHALAAGLRGKRILVTGATGPLGMKLVAVLGAAGNQVRVLTRQNLDVAALWPDAGVESVIADLESADSLQGALTDRDLIFHLASYHPRKGEPDPENHQAHVSVTVKGTDNLIAEAKAAGCPRILFSSSTRVIDGSVNLYATSKHRAEELILASGLPATVLRFAPLYGTPGRGNIELIRRLYRKSWFPLLPDIGDCRSLVHVEDAVQALLVAALSDQTIGSTLTITDTMQYSFSEIARIFAGESKRWIVPKWLLNLAVAVLSHVEDVVSKPMPLNRQTLKKLSQTDCFGVEATFLALGYRPVHRLSEWADRS